MNERANPEVGIPSEFGEEINGPGRSYFDDVMFDNILDAMLELSAMVWTYHDRVNVLEKVLAEKGIDVTEQIEAHRPDDAEIAARAEERAQFVQRVFGTFVRRPGKGVGIEANKEPSNEPR